MEREELIALARKARELSYSPYSHYAVGAAVLCKDGAVYQGANVENASFPVSMCAERNAIFHAMMEGRKKEDFVALAIVANDKKPVTPCGACRQVLAEMFPEHAPIYLANLAGEEITTDIASLLPMAFKGEDL